VEGLTGDVEDFWKRIRCENWQRLSVIDRIPIPEKESGFLFETMQEIFYDQSDFFKFLEEKKCESVIKDYLGI